MLRFAPVAPPPTPLDLLVPEVWAAIFSFGGPEEYQALQLTSKWAHDLFWDMRRVYVFLPDYKPKALCRVLRKANPVQVTYLSAAHNPGLGALHIAYICGLGFTHLQRLNLAFTACTDEALALVCETSRNLKSLSIRTCELITITGIASVCRKLRRLEKLMIEGCRLLTDECLMPIGHLKKLQYLSVSLSHRSLLERDTGEGVAVSRTMLPKLRSLVGDCNVSHLAGLKNLTYLDFGPFMALTHASIESLRANLKQLKYLAIPQGQLLDTPSIALLGQMKSVEALMLNKIYFASVASLVHLPALRLLNLRFCSIEDADLLDLAHCEKLEELDISHCHLITYGGLKRYMELIECRHFNEVGHVEPGHVCHPRPLKVVRTDACKGLQSSGYHAVESRPERDGAGRIAAWNDYVPVVAQ
jgi:Leucine-rich repeat (LRR) protein